MIVRCLTCNHVVIGKPKATIGCVCDPDAPTWLAIIDDRNIIGGTYRNYIPLTEVPND